MHGASPRSASPSASPWLSSMTAPRQKNCVPMVAMMDGTPTYATRKPLQRPIPKPIRMATMTPSQTCPVCIAVSAKPNPATASVEGKHKSISPAATTNVSPSARKPYRGKVESRLSYMGHARNARAPVIMNSASNAKNNPVSHSWLRVLAGNARRMRPAHHAPLPSARDSSRFVRSAGDVPSRRTSPTVLPLSMNRNRSATSYA